jgi:uncharacterized GH25 family protein
MMRRVAAVLAALLIIDALAADAHEYWLSPSSYRPTPGAAVEVGALVGTGFRGERRPYASTRARRFVARGRGEQDLRPAAVHGDLTWARITPRDAGGVMIGYVSDFATIELPAEEFDAYLEEEGLDDARAARRRLGAAAGPGRERYGRCPKAWIAGSDSGRATRPLGLPLELVPLADPTAAASLRVRVLYRGKPLGGALVRAWRQDLAAGATPRDGAARDSVGLTCEARTDRSGVALLPVERPGEWLVSTVHMVACRDRAIADWESLWASLTFARESP